MKKLTLLLMVLIASSFAMAQQPCVGCAQQSGFTVCRGGTGYQYCQCNVSTYCYFDHVSGEIICFVNCTQSTFCFGQCLGSARYPTGEDTIAKFPWIADESVIAHIAAKSSVKNIDLLMQHIQIQHLAHGVDNSGGIFQTVRWKGEVNDEEPFTEKVTFYPLNKPDGSPYTADNPPEPIESVTFTGKQWQSTAGSLGPVGEYKTAAQAKVACQEKKALAEAEKLAH